MIRQQENSPLTFARKITELRFMFVTAYTLKQQRVLMKQSKQQSGDSQQMECEVLTHWRECRRQQWT